MCMHYRWPPVCAGLKTRGHARVLEGDAPAVIRQSFDAVRMHGLSAETIGALQPKPGMSLTHATCNR